VKSDARQPSQEVALDHAARRHLDVAGITVEDAGAEKECLAAVDRLDRAVILRLVSASPAGRRNRV